MSYCVKKLSMIAKPTVRALKANGIAPKPASLQKKTLCKTATGESSCC